MHAIVNPIISAINPNFIGTLMASTGSAIGPDYKQVPTYKTFKGVRMQAQALTAKEIEHLDSLNISNVPQSVYMNGRINGLDRQGGLGGDLLIFDGQTWLVVAVLESWRNDGWTKVAVSQQVK